jgi:hypothetical protein
MDLSWDGKMVNGLRLYAADDYHSGFLLMLVFAAVAITGASRIRETHCRNITITD